MTVQVAVLEANLPFDTQPTSVNVTLYACTVPDGSCRVAADLGTIDAIASDMPVMPDGRLAR